MLIDEATVRRYKADLTDEIEPQINELISRAEKGLRILLKKESTLKAKVDANQSRFSSRAAMTVNTSGMSKLDVRRIQMLTKERERAEEEMAALEKEVAELELTAGRI